MGISIINMVWSSDPLMFIMGFIYPQDVIFLVNRGPELEYRGLNNLI